MWTRQGAHGLAVTAAVLVAGACSLPARYEVDEFTVRAPTHVEAESAAAELVRWRDVYVERIPGATVRPLELHVEDVVVNAYRGVDDRLAGGYSPEHGVIVVRRDTASGTHVIGHELLHAMLDESWDTLPLYLEEGLAEALPARLRDVSGGIEFMRTFTFVTWADDSASIRFEDAVSGVMLFELEVVAQDRPTLAEITDSEWLKRAGGEQQGYAYSVGLFLAERLLATIGLEGIHAMCVESAAAGQREVPWDVVAAKAGVAGKEPQDWVALAATRSGVELRGMALDSAVRACMAARDEVLGVLGGEGDVVVRVSGVGATAVTSRAALREAFMDPAPRASRRTPELMPATGRTDEQGSRSVSG